MPNRDLENMRKDYTLRELSRCDLHDDPIEQFKGWFNEARNSEVYEPNAMALATVGSQLNPSCRIVLLKGVDHGFIFYTNYDSNKGSQIGKNNQAAATLWWDKLERQVRIEGKVEKVDEKMSDEYFLSRPIGSQIGAAASPQSQVIESYQQLVDLKNEVNQESLVRPDNWGGYRIVPTRIEFWQGRSNRLHDRFVFSYVENSKSWQINRLAP